MNSSLYRTPSVGLTEQNLFDKTVQEMSSKMINISALNDQLPQTQWFERQKLYSKKVSNIKNPLPLKCQVPKVGPKKKGNKSNYFYPFSKLYFLIKFQLFSDSFRERCSSLESMSCEDIDLINHFSDKSINAVKKGFSYNSEESILIEFKKYCFSTFETFIEFDFKIS